MRELKARRAYFSEDEYDRGAHKICAKVSDCGYDRRNDWWSYAFEDEVYLKSEADKVIEEKDNEIARLNDKYLQYKVLDKEHCRDLNTQERRFALQMAHHKHKRCLAMAMWCRRNRLHACVCGPVEKIDFWEKWRKRWLELADKFKEAK